MPCNCGKGKKKVAGQNPANFRQGSGNIRRQPVRAVRPPANKQNNVNTAGRPTIKRSVRSIPQGVQRKRYTKAETMARVLNR